MSNIGLLAVGALDPVLLVVVPFAVRPALVPHVLPVQQDGAGGALEAPYVVLFVECHQGLGLPQLLAAAGTAVLAHLHGQRVPVLVGLDAGLAQAVLASEGDSLAGREGSLAASTSEAGLVEGVPKRRDHLALHKLFALGALGAKVCLVAFGTVVAAVAGEEAPWKKQNMRMMMMSLLLSLCLQRMTPSSYFTAP